MSVTVLTASADETRAWGARLAASLHPPLVIALYGNLGAGKTVLAQGIAAGLGAHGPVTSPTFTLVNEYPLKDGGVLYHIDCYRFEDAVAEALAVGIPDLFDQGIVLIEWAERIAPLLPPDRLDIELIDAGPGRRRLTLARTRRRTESGRPVDKVDKKTRKQGDSPPPTLSPSLPPRVPHSLPPMLLALDTATQFASIALYDGAAVLAELNWRSARRHTVELAPQIETLLTLAQLRPRDISALAVAIGPGSYTGTRVALSLAKGIVAAAGCALIGIPTLDALAYPHICAGQTVCALVEAGRGRYCWALYAPGEGPPQRLGVWRLHPLLDILAQLTPPVRFVGELNPAARDTLHTAWGEAASLATPALATRRAGALAELAWRRWQAGDSDDPAALSPIYLG